MSQLSVTHSVHVSGTINEDSSFFYRKLQVVPSIRTTVEFSVSYMRSSICNTAHYPLMSIYTTYHQVNIEKRCSYIRYGQPRNENLHPHLRVGHRYRRTTCQLSGSETVNCRGKVTIQDYIPRSFYLTFGFHCDWLSVNSLKGLRYYIRFIKQSNITSVCTEYAEGYRSSMYDRFFRQTNIPNLIGDETLDQVLKYLVSIRRLGGLMSVHGTCYQHFWEVACHIFLPKCQPAVKKMIHPCRDMCRNMVEGCWQKWLQVFTSSRRFRLDHASSIDTWKLINCDYLPSVHDNISCF